MKMIFNDPSFLLLRQQAMSSWLSPNEYFRDWGHPSKMFSLEIGNLLLNMLKDIITSNRGGKTSR